MRELKNSVGPRERTLPRPGTRSHWMRGPRTINVGCYPVRRQSLSMGNATHAHNGLGSRRDQDDLEDLGPELAGDEKPVLVTVIGNSIQHINVMGVIHRT